MISIIISILSSCVYMVYIYIVRVSAFTIRAIVIGTKTAGENLGFLKADQILFGVGYAGLLYSGFTLVLNLEQVSRSASRSERNVFMELTGNRRIFRLVMVIAVSLGIPASSTVSIDGTSGPTSNALRQASTVIFLALTVLLLVQTIYLARFNVRESRMKDGINSFGAKHGFFILMVIASLLLIREVFITATMTPSTHAKQFNEHFWYPLVAVPEILAVVFYMTPGLVPSKDEIAGAQIVSKGQYDVA